MASSKQKPKKSSSSFMGITAKPDDAFFHILPVPVTGSKSQSPAMAAAPSAILEASQDLEPWDGRSTPARHGIYTHAALAGKGSIDEVQDKVAAEVAKIISQDKFPIGLGGSGAVSYGMVKGLLDAGIENFGVIHIDAKADLKAYAEGKDGDQWDEFSVMKKVLDEDIPVFQLGVRSMSKDEADARKVYGVQFYDADFLVSRNITKIDLPGEFPDFVYISIDTDGFDPSVFPSLDALPGGLGWWQTLAILESISQQASIIGLDLTEYRPNVEQTYHDKAAALLLYKVMGIVERARL